MSYGLKYQTQFDSVTDEFTASKRYTIQFLYKNYSGGVTSVTCGDTPIIQSYGEDSPNPAIKGSNVNITLINKNNSLPLSAFNTEADDDIKVLLLDENSNVLFAGFIVNEDSYEVMVDVTHYINLSASDSLGLLKGVILSEAEVRRSFYSTQYRTNGDNFVVYVGVYDTAFYPQTGNTIEIDGVPYVISTAVNEDTIIVPSAVPYNWTITLTTDTGGISNNVGYIYLTGTINLLNRNSLFSIMALCLANTNLNLFLNVYCNVRAHLQDDTRSHFEQTMIDTQLFVSGETYEDCYSVLTKILSAFRCTLLQANGSWNIIHWDEMKNYTNNQIPCYQYDDTYTFLGTDILQNGFSIGPDPQLTRPVYPLNKGLRQPLKFVRKKFEYKQPQYLLRNYDLQILGNLIRQYTSGTDTISEYVATNWTTGAAVALLPERFIRVIVDNLGNETDRYLVIQGPGDGIINKQVSSDPIEINAGDKIKFTCDVKGDNSFSGTWSLVYAIMATDGTAQKYVDENPPGNGNWVSGIGFIYDGSGNAIDTWNSVEISSGPIPYSGLLYCYLTRFGTSVSAKTYYKNMRLEYTPYINDSSKIIGQIHKYSRDANVKSNTDVEITIDDSPRNNNVGTLFLNTVTNLIQDRTTLWVYNSAPSEGYRLGELTSREELIIGNRLRTKYEGEFIGLYQNSVLSALTISTTDFDLTKSYLFGLLNIDYRRNKFNGTLYEWYDATEPVMGGEYSFTYIYNTQ